MCFPHEIISNFKEHKAVRNILNKENITVLDIGCGLPFTHFFLFHDFGFNEIVGVDRASEKEIIAEIVSKQKKLKNSDIKSVYDFYISQIKFSEEEKIHLNYENFSNAFKIHYESDAYCFLNELDSTLEFDFIILSNILHLFSGENEVKLLFEKVNSKLKNNGLLFVKVNHDENIIARSLKQKTYSEVLFKRYFVDFKEIYFSKIISQDSLATKSMLYFGYKE
jgi:SAM-dependent methyltransferase